jgi:cation transport ATPase
MGNGSDIAIEAADLVLLKSDPIDTAKAVNLSRLTIKNIKQNLFWAFLYNTICIPVAAGVLYPFGILLSPMLAGLAMSLSSVFVVTNALRLRGKKL